MRQSQTKREKTRKQREAKSVRRTRSTIAADALAMSETDAARRLGLSVRTLQRWRVEGTGPTFLKLGRLVAYHPDSLAAFLSSAQRTSTSAAA